MIAVVPVMLIRLNSWFIDAAITLQRNAASVLSCYLLLPQPAEHAAVTLLAAKRLFFRKRQYVGVTFVLTPQSRNEMTAF